jgi:hypothetical protein
VLSSQDADTNDASISVEIEYVVGENGAAGFDALADALLLMRAGAALQEALDVAHNLSITLLPQQARRDLLERQAETLRRQLEQLEQKLNRAA